MLASSPALLLLCLALLLACSDASRPEDETPAPDTPSLDESSLLGEWKLREIGGQEIPAPLEAKFALEPEGRVHGHSGVNRMSGTWTLDGDTFRFGPLATTRMAGPPEAMELESRVHEALGRVAKAAIDEQGHLRLSSEKDKLLLVAVPAPR